MENFKEKAYEIGQIGLFLIAVPILRCIIRKITETQEKEFHRKQMDLDYLLDLKYAPAETDNKWLNLYLDLFFGRYIYTFFWIKWQLTPTSKLEKLFYL